MARGRPLRADARRNRERVLRAARAAFEAEGVGVPLDEIARRAGVGAGTVHRHFPTKEALLEAIILGTMESLAAEARAGCDSDDPGAAFAAYFARLAEEGMMNRAFTEVLRQAGVDMGAVAGQAGRDLLDAFGALLARAQRAGAVRADVTPRQVKALLIGVFAGADWLGGGGDERRRLVAVVLDGLRAR
ncbi:AcrR family transcriptional regulator [Thermocatellispora tengchongensis]|uniref:AcrR family transcriptional regulator n=1 Tax=Thermocatellispora tengchongensis TaxID=1073253 RepID=A0A840PNW1_9ACTN|nr:TetR/AcrR family transcriptional regulator [Thermocatellispora tengchongensis]MBB5139733.1 AcrR family transcriptional regulator [Thermocatellispora tengchongensis]